MFHPLQNAPAIVIRSDKKLAIAHATPAIIKLIDPRHVTNSNPSGYAYEGYFLSAEDKHGVPYLATFHHSRCCPPGGGSGPPARASIRSPTARAGRFYNARTSNARGRFLNTGASEGLARAADPLAPNQLALGDSVDFQVFDHRRAVTKACLVAGSGDLLRPSFGLFSRVPDFDDADLPVRAECGYVK